jgi:putative iron-only hydrogenase system regulator
MKTPVGNFFKTESAASPMGYGTLTTQLRFRHIRCQGIPNILIRRRFDGKENRRHSDNREREKLHPPVEFNYIRQQRHYTRKDGLPLRGKGVNVISLIIEGTTDQIGTLSGKAGRLPGVQVKSVLTRNLRCDNE